MAKRKGQTQEERAAAREQRAAERAARQDSAQQRRRSARRNRMLAKLAGLGVAVAAVVVLFTSLPGASYAPGSEGAFIAGVERFLNPTGHVDGVVDYPQTPPAGGEHNPVWLNCGFYTEPVRNELAVHALEHGAVWVTYDPALSAADLDVLRGHLPSSYVILSPYPGLPAPIVLSAWNAQLRVSIADDERIPQFFEEYWRSQYVPEPGALCTGGIDGPGRS